MKRFDLRPTKKQNPLRRLWHGFLLATGMVLFFLVARTYAWHSAHHYYPDATPTIEIATPSATLVPTICLTPTEVPPATPTEIESTPTASPTSPTDTTQNAGSSATTQPQNNDSRLAPESLPMPQDEGIYK